MTNFKVGDRVRERVSGSDYVGTVTYVASTYVRVRLDGFNHPAIFRIASIEHLTVKFDISEEDI
jgi:hypothetical protein